MKYLLPYLPIIILLSLCGCQAPRVVPSPALAAARTRQLVVRYGHVSDSICDAYIREALHRITPVTASSIHVTILNTDSPIALSPGIGEILISKGLIRLFSNEAELVFMLAHEVGHYALHHHELVAGQDESTAFEERRDLELEADRFAIQAMAQSGYDATYAVQALNDVYTRINQSPDADGYPSLQDRIMNLATTLMRNPTLRGGIADRRSFQACRAQF